MWIILAVIILGVLLLSRTSFEIRDEIEIDASADKVWATVIDFENYKNWNSQLTFLGGTVQPNGKLHLKLAAAGAEPYEFKPDISYWQEKQRFAWIAKTGLPRIFDGEHFFELKDIGNGKTLLTNREEYRGILSQIFKQLPMMKTAPDGFKKMNLELKNYIEKKIIAVFFAILSITSCSPVQDDEKQEHIDTIFDKMELQGVDTKRPLLYGYYFYDQDQSKLEKLKDELLKDKYELVRLEKAEDQEFLLQVEKVEIHSRASLLERENELEQLSKTFQVASYDGWDVGNPDPTKPLVSKDDGFEKSLDNQSPAELYKMAMELYDSKSHDKAVVVFQKCIESNYKLDTCNYKQGVSYLGLGQAKLGIEKFEAALKINPKYFKACFNIGATCYDIEEYQKSIDYYQKAAKLDPKDDRVYYGIAAAQFVLGQLKAAEENCQTALKLNPGNENAKALLGDMKKK